MCLSVGLLPLTAHCLYHLSPSSLHLIETKSSLLFVLFPLLYGLYFLIACYYFLVSCWFCFTKLGQIFHSSKLNVLKYLHFCWPNLLI